MTNYAEIDKNLSMKGAGIGRMKVLLRGCKKNETPNVASQNL